MSQNEKKTSEQKQTQPKEKTFLKSLKKGMGRFFKWFLKRPFNVKVIILAVVALCILLPTGSVIVKNEIKNVTERSGQTVELGLKNIGELATQAGYFRQVRLYKNSAQLWGMNVLLTQKKAIFSYDGIIKAGIDFEAIEINKDKNSKTIRVKLPEAKILSVEIDEKSFKIYDEANNIFNPLTLTDMNTSLVEMKEEAKTDAIHNGLLENTRTNTEVLIKAFLSGAYDMQEYTIVFEESVKTE